MKTINSWKARNKQSDKVRIYARFGKLTVFELYFDVSSKEYRVVIFNFGIKNN